MAADTGSPRSRRALLAGGLGGLAAVALSALGRPLAVRATDGDVLHVGDELTASSVTKLSNGSSAATVIEGATATGIGVAGTASGTGTGILGKSTGWRAVLGISEASSTAAIVGRSEGSATGVLGVSVGSGTAYPPTRANTGVHGAADQDADAAGVYGESHDGTGVLGESFGGRGVEGRAPTGTGVRGWSDNSVGVLGEGQIAVRGEGHTSTNAPGCGVFGTSSEPSGATCGVAASVQSPDGFGLAAYNPAGGTAIHARSGTSIEPATPRPSTAIVGVAEQPHLSARGILGIAPTGQAVRGESSTGNAVVGQTTSGIGVSGNSSTSTGVFGTSESEVGVRGSSETGSGVEGTGATFGTYGFSAHGTGVYGESDTGVGVLAESEGGTALIADTTAPAKAAVIGRSQGHSTGILGLSGTGTIPAAVAKTGVYGRATQDATSRGVYGYSTAGRGVQGGATTGTAGYFATSTSGGLRTGYALRAVGRVKLDNCAGVATIPATKSSVVVTPGIDLVSTSAVVATLQGSAGGTTTVHRCVVNTTTNTFTIYLTAAATRNVRVAWHAFG